MLVPKKLFGDTPVRKSTYGLLFNGILSASLQNICCTLRLDIVVDQNSDCLLDFQLFQLFPFVSFCVHRLSKPYSWSCSQLKHFDNTLLL